MFFKSHEKIELIVGLDIGSSAVRMVAGHIAADDNGQRGRSVLRIVGASSVPSEGIQKGVVTSIEDLVSCISYALEQLERVVGMPIESAWVGVNGPFIISQESKGVVAVAKTNGEITSEDAARVIDAARTVPLPLNYDILHVLPRAFSVDGQTGIKDPVGMTGMRLEVDTKIVYGMSSHVKNVTRAVYRTGIDIEDIVLSILATGDAVATPRQKDLGVVVLNVGASTTSLVVYEEGVTLHIAVLPIGSQHITNDIAVGLRTSIDVAERVKIEYGHCMPKDVSKKDIIDLATLGGGEQDVASRHYVSEIINARAAEICEKARLELVKIGRSGKLPSGVLCTGGGANIGGFVDLVKEEFALPASLGYACDVSSVSNINSELEYTTAIGLVKWGANLGHSTSSASRQPKRSGGNMLDNFKKMKEWLMP